MRFLTASLRFFHGTEQVSKREPSPVVDALFRGTFLAQVDPYGPALYNDRKMDSRFFGGANIAFHTLSFHWLPFANAHLTDAGLAPPAGWTKAAGGRENRCPTLQMRPENLLVRLRGLLRSLREARVTQTTVSEGASPGTGRTGGYGRHPVWASQ